MKNARASDKVYIGVEMKNVAVKKREINTNPLDNWIVEDSHDFDAIDFTIDEELDGLNLYLLFRNREDEGGVEKLDGTTWIPSHSFTALNGQMKIQLIAIDEDTYSASSEIRWSTKYATITIPANIEPTELVDEPAQSMIEDIICGGLE